MGFTGEMGHPDDSRTTGRSGAWALVLILFCSSVLATARPATAQPEEIFEFPQSSQLYQWAALAPAVNAQIVIPFAASTDPARTRAEINAWHYNSDYLFGLSRRVASGGAIPAVRPILFLFTFPLDLVLLPLAAIGGFFG